MEPDSSSEKKERTMKDFRQFESVEGSRSLFDMLRSQHRMRLLEKIQLCPSVPKQKQAKRLNI